MAYEVFVNGELLYDSALVNDKELQIISPTININEEGGSFSFTFPKNHSLWGKIIPGINNNTEHPIFTQKTDTVTVMENNKWLWEGYISDYQEAFNGDYNITCDGALCYLKHVDLPLKHILDKTRRAGESQADFFKRAYKTFVKQILRQYNDRINELMALHHIDLNHQKIYFSGSLSKIDIPNDIQVPNHFSRIVNFESCYDALQKRIAEDFLGHFYLTRSYAHTLSATYYGPVDQTDETEIQDDSITSDVVRDVLLLNFKSTHIPLDNLAVHLGNHLLDYNVSETFDLVTSVIPRGATASDNRTDGVRWWYKDARATFHDIEQYASYGYSRGKYEEHGPNDYRLIDSSVFRIFLPDTVSNNELVKKYGLNEVILDFGDDVVAKYPARHGKVDNPTYGYPYSTNRWRDGKVYDLGEIAWGNQTNTGPHGVDNLIYAFCAKKAHRAGSSTCPDPSQTIGPNYGDYWEEFLVGVNTIGNNIGSSGDAYTIYYADMDHITSWPYYNSLHSLSQNLEGWLSIDDYLDAPNEWDTSKNYMCNTWYIEDYTRALRILALDYLQNQQFNELELSISCDMVVLDEIRTETTLPYTTDLAIYYMHIGDLIPVSADLFGSNLKPYQITEVSIKLDNPSESTMTLGGKTTDLSALVRNKQA